MNREIKIDLHDNILQRAWADYYEHVVHITLRPLAPAFENHFVTLCFAIFGELYPDYRGRLTEQELYTKFDVYNVALERMMPADDFRKATDEFDGDVELLVAHFNTNEQQILDRAKQLRETIYEPKGRESN